MSDLTSDRHDPRLTHGVDTEPVGMAEAYLVLSPEELAKGFVRPVRRAYEHTGPRLGLDRPCNTVTTMSQALAETYAREPQFYGATYCVACKAHRPVGPEGEFVWAGTDIKVGS